MNTQRLLRRLFRSGPLLLLFLRELVASQLNVALLTLAPGGIRPGIVAYPLTVTGDGEIALLANLITLTPGTLSVDVSADRKTLFIHAIAVTDRDHLIGHIASGFETRILEVFA